MKKTLFLLLISINSFAQALSFAPPAWLKNNVTGETLKAFGPENNEKFIFGSNGLKVAEYNSSGKLYGWKSIGINSGFNDYSYQTSTNYNFVVGGKSSFGYHTNMPTLEKTGTYFVDIAKQYSGDISRLRFSKYESSGLTNVPKWQLQHGANDDFSIQKVNTNGTTDTTNSIYINAGRFNFGRQYGMNLSKFTFGGSMTIQGALNLENYKTAGFLQTNSQGMVSVNTEKYLLETNPIAKGKLTISQYVDEFNEIQLPVLKIGNSNSANSVLKATGTNGEYSEGVVNADEVVGLSGVYAISSNVNSLLAKKADIENTQLKGAVEISSYVNELSELIYPSLNLSGTFSLGSISNVEEEISTKLNISTASTTYMPYVGGNFSGRTNNILSENTAYSASTAFQNGNNVGVVNQIYNNSNSTLSYAGIKLTTRSSLPTSWSILNVNAGLGIGDLVFGYGGSTASSERMRLNNSGHLGIGKLPQRALDVAGDISNDGNAYFATSTGNLGIGTNTPNSKLHLIGSGNFSSTSSSNFDYATRYQNIVFSRGDIPTTYTNAISNSHSGTLSEQTMSFEVANGSSTRNTAMTINGTGNIGIGTVSPNAPLQFANTVANRKIVLWEDANNDQQFFGFGLSSGVLRYQVGTSGGSHVFVAANSSTTSQQLLSINGDQTVTYTPLTTSQINALTKVKGKQAYNGDTDKPVWCDGTVWRYADGANM